MHTTTEGTTVHELNSHIAVLPLEQKVRLLSGASSFSLSGDETIGLEPVVLSDGPTGVRGDVVVGGRESCLLPNASLLAQTWNDEALIQAGQILAEEAIDQHIHVVLGPTVNLHRTPLGGRLFEAFSEDPLLSGRLGAAYVHGLQRNGIGASAKHFLGNESETERTSMNSVISDAALREVYLMPFLILVEDANPWTVMAAYNRVNGVASTEQHELLTGILKREWGYDGVVMSDWHATSSTIPSVTAGLDLVMPGPDTPWSRDLVEAVRDGYVEEAVIDEHLGRLLTLAHRVGARQQLRTWSDDVPPVDGPLRREQLTQLAASGMVVLRNEQAVLPLQRETVGTVAVIGRHATDTIAQGGGSARVHAPHVVSIADGLIDAFGAEQVDIVDGVETRHVLPTVAPDLVTDPDTGTAGVRARVYDVDGAVIAERHLDVAELEDAKSGWVAGAHRIELCARVNVTEPGEMQVGARGPGRWRITTPSHDEYADITFHDGPGGGFFRPKSHASTVRLEPGDLVTVSVEQTELPRILGMVIAPARRAPAAVIAAATEAAARVDTAIVVVGNTPDQETEGQDKTTLALPGYQDALVTAVAAVAARTIVVVNAATPVLMPWAKDVDAIVFAGLPGQEAGSAVAAALTGAVLPEGRLVTTFPGVDGVGPAWMTQPTQGNLVYDDDLFIGHRGWAAAATEPAFWFGAGLGLTSWCYGSADLTAAPDGTVNQVVCTVTNTGKFDGRETVQVYLAPDDETLPVRLIGWAQCDVAPGQSSTATVNCDARLQRRWDQSKRSWMPMGAGTVLIGRNLGDVRARIRTDNPADGRAVAEQPDNRIEA